MDRRIHGISPCHWILLHVPGRQPGQHVIVLRGRSNYFPGVTIKGDSFCALRPAIYAQINHASIKAFSQIPGQRGISLCVSKFRDFLPVNLESLCPQTLQIRRACMQNICDILLPVSTRRLNIKR